MAKGSNLEHFSAGCHSDLTASTIASPTGAPLAAVPMFILVKRGAISKAAVDVGWKWRRLIKKRLVVWIDCWGNKRVALAAGVSGVHRGWGRELSTNGCVFSNRPEIRRWLWAGGKGGVVGRDVARPGARTGRYARGARAGLDRG